jgi:hypothetical protein
LSSLSEKKFFSGPLGNHREEGEGMSGVLRKRQYRILRQGVPVLLAAVFLAAFGIAGDLLPGVGGNAAEAGQPAAQSVVQPEAQRLVGQWVRPDGGYVLEVREVAKDGTLKAAYFNPRPINVGRAEWRRKASTLMVLVELRDVNYPGSTYTLQYDPASDRLKGTYFQAVEKQTYTIEFVRAR